MNVNMTRKLNQGIQSGAKKVMKVAEKQLANQIKKAEKPLVNAAKDGTKIK